MKASELKIDLESKRNNPDIKDSVKKIFENAITKLESYPENKELFSEEIRKLLHFLGIPTSEEGSFVEFINTNSGPSPVENSYSEIYYLMHAKQTSCLHSLTTTETWRWIGGSDVILYVFKENKIEIITLNAENREYTIEQGTLEKPTWFGAKNANQADESFSLVTCNCTPGFRMKDHYKDPSPEVLENLSKRFSKDSNVITELTPSDEKVATSLAGKKFFRRLSCERAKGKGKDADFVEVVRSKPGCSIS